MIWYTNLRDDYNNNNVFFTRRREAHSTDAQFLHNAGW